MVSGSRRSRSKRSRRSGGGVIHCGLGTVEESKVNPSYKLAVGTGGDTVCL